MTRWAGNSQVHATNNHEACPWLQGLSRRGFLRFASGLAAVGLCEAGRQAMTWAASEALQQPQDPRHPTPFERLHLPALRMPRVTLNGAHVPLVIDMGHPMEPDHYVRSLHILNESDPFPSKGIFHLTPANGRAHLAVQARMHSGDSAVLVIAECNQHGRWTVRQPFTIPDGSGGCATPVTATASRPVDEEIQPPALRIPELIERGQLRRGDVIRVQMKVKHPNRTGLALHDGQFIRETEPFYIENMDVFYGGRRVSRYEMSPGLSDNPFITFMLRVTEEAPIQVVLTNSRGERFEAIQGLILAP
jgi:desulfoferrodoxin (superoxide reductase-like protein)